MELVDYEEMTSEQRSALISIIHETESLGQRLMSDRYDEVEALCRQRRLNVSRQAIIREFREAAGYP